MKFRHAEIDPNWPYAKRLKEQHGGKGRTKFGDGASGKYRLSSLDEIKAMPVGKIMEKDSLIHLWVTGPHLHEAGDVIRAWGLKPITCEFVWVKLSLKGLRELAKQPMMILELFSELGILHEVLLEGVRRLPGNYTASNVEFVILGKRGRPTQPRIRMFPQLIFSVLQEHSRKPDRVKQYIQSAYDGPYVELYARRLFDGWVALGNEVPGQEGLLMERSMPVIAGLPQNADWKAALLKEKEVAEVKREEGERILVQGTQIAYVPMHVRAMEKPDEWLDHDDTLFGFVTGHNGSAVFCRYWKRGFAGSVLKTVACSEATDYEDLIVHHEVDQYFVDAWMEELYGDN